MDKLFYLLRCMACSGVLLLFYILVLGKLKCFRFNRFYLLFSVLASLVIPLLFLQVSQQDTTFYNKLLTKTDLPIEQTANIPNINDNQYESIANYDNQPVDTYSSNPIVKNTPSKQIVSNVHISYAMIATCVYWTITGFLLLQLSTSITILFRRIAKNHKTKSDNYTFVLVNSLSSPYTFFHYIFLDKEKFLNCEIQEEILIHEKQHAKELHAVDLLLMRLIIAFGWVSPILFLYQKYIRENHEYLADNSVIQKSSNKAQYQVLILGMQQNCSNKTIQLSNSFNFLSLKKRLTMINRTSKPRRNFLLGILSIPLLLCCVILFAQRKNENIQKAENKVIATTTFNPDNDNNTGITQEEFNYYIAEMKKGNYKFDPKNRQGDWFKDLQNSPEGDSLIHLYKRMTWKQKSLTQTTMPYEAIDSLSEADWNLYNQTVSKLLTDKQKKERDNSPHRQFKNKNMNSRIYDQPICLEDKYIKKYGYINLMLHYMSQHQINRTPYIVMVPIKY